MNAAQLSTTLKKAFQLGHQILVVGKPGVGKSEVISTTTSESGLDYVVMHPSVGEPTDVKGFPWCSQTADGVKAEFVTYGEMERLLHPKRRTVCCFDDVGQASEQMQAALMQVLWARELNGKKISDNIVFCGATNDITDKAAVSGFIEPFKSRWHSIIRFTPDHEDWIKWAYNHSMPDDLIAYTRYRPGSLNAHKATKTLESSPCPRTVAMLGNMILAKYDKSVMYELGAGSVGEAYITDFLAYQKMRSQLFDLKLCLSEPDTAPIPDEPSVLFSVTTGLARMTNPSNFKKCLQYAERLPKEFCVMLMKDINLANGTSMMKVKDYTTWLIDNQVYIMGERE